MGNVKYCDTDEKNAGIPADVLELLESRRSSGDGVLYSMAEDLFFFAELIDMQRCIIRMMQIMGDRLPKELPDVTTGLADTEALVLEKWVMFMERM